MNIKYKDLSPAQLLASGGLGLPFVLLSGVVNDFWNTMNAGLLFSLCVAVAIVFYIGAHWLPVKFILIAGTCGWLTVPLLLIFGPH